MKIDKVSVSLLLAVVLGLASGCGGGGGGWEIASGPFEIAPPEAVDPGGIWIGTVESPDLGNAVGISTSAGELRIMDDRGVSLFAQVQQVGYDFVDPDASLFAVPGSVFSSGTSVVNGPVNAAIYEQEAIGMGVLPNTGDELYFQALYSEIHRRNSSLTRVSDTWQDESDNTYTIDADGSIFGQNARGCVYDGQISLIDMDYNVYRVEINTSSCQEENGNFSGLGAVFDDAEAGENGRLLILASEGDIRALTLDLSRM
jgi:hypothetical protein